MKRWLAFSLTLLSACLQAQPADTNAVPENIVRPATNLTAVPDPEMHLRAYLKLQEQLHTTLLAIEQARLESSQEARTNSESLALRLQLLEESLATQREQQWQSLHDSNRTMLLLGGSAIGLGLIALAFAALFQARGMNRLADIAGLRAQERPFPAAALPPALGMNEPFLLENGTNSSTNRVLLATVEQLQQRIQELERTTFPELSFANSPQATEEPRPTPTGTRNGAAQIGALEQAAALLGKAQVLLSLGQVEAALTCYDRALHEAPNLAETHLRRGQALEKLKRYDDAIASYDRAIAINRHLTQAYLAKGAVFNQQERYPEALAAYEQALRAETKGS